MKKLILLLLTISTILASTVEVELKIYDNILSSLFVNKQTIHIWSDNPKKEKLFANIKNVEIVPNKENADLLILYKTKDLNTNKIVFAGTYSLLKEWKDKAIGGFYWQKGRPNLIFLRKNLETHKIKLTPELQKYIEDEI